jgi:hypothetical protein
LSVGSLLLSTTSLAAKKEAITFKTCDVCLDNALEQALQVKLDAIMGGCREKKEPPFVSKSSRVALSR